MCLSENKEQEKKKSIQVHRCVYPKTKNKKKKTKTKTKERKKNSRRKKLKKFDKQSLILRHPLKSSINDSILMV